MGLRDGDIFRKNKIFKTNKRIFLFLFFPNSKNEASSAKRQKFSGAKSEQSRRVIVDNIYEP